MDQNQQQQPVMPSAGSVFNAVSEKVLGMLGLIVTVLICLAVLSLVYYLIFGIVQAINYKSFSTFLSYFVSDGIGSCARYAFFAGALAVLKKIVKK